MSFLFRYLRFHDIIGGIHVPVDDGVDKLNRKYTLLVFLFLALPIFTKQYIGDPIECFAPVYFAEHQARYINSYCWTQSTYYMVPVGDPEDDGDQQDPPDRIMPDEVDYFIGFETVTHIGNERLRRVRVSYYQWAPLILLVQGLCFYIPFLIWNSCANNAGVKLRRLLKKASDIASLPPGCQQREALLAEFVDQFHTLVMGEAGWCADLQCGNLQSMATTSTSSSSSGSSQASGRRGHNNQEEVQGGERHHGRHSNQPGCCLISIPIVGSLLACCLRPCSSFGLVGPSKYLCLLYLAVKTAYVCNVALQFFLLGQFLGRGYLKHGLELMNRLIVTGDWWASPRFPLSTLCQVRADMSGGLRSYTCQCVLPINVFNEKIFSVVWFYMAFLMPLNVGSLLFWIYKTFESNRLHYIRLCLWRTRLVELNQIHRTVRRLSQSYLGWDGVFLLRLIEHNHGSIMATLIMSRLWEFYANQMKLQEDANQLALATNAQHTLSNTTTALSNQHQLLAAAAAASANGPSSGHPHAHAHHGPAPLMPAPHGPHFGPSAQQQQQQAHSHPAHAHPPGGHTHGPPQQQHGNFPHPPHGPHVHHSGQVSSQPGHHPLHAANTHTLGHAHAHLNGPFATGTAALLAQMQQQHQHQQHHPVGNSTSAGQPHGPSAQAASGNVAAAAAALAVAAAPHSNSQPAPGNQQQPGGPTSAAQQQQHHAHLIGQAMGQSGVPTGAGQQQQSTQATGLVAGPTAQPTSTSGQHQAPTSTAQTSTTSFMSAPASANLGVPAGPPVGPPLPPPPPAHVKAVVAAAVGSSVSAAPQQQQSASGIGRNGGATNGGPRAGVAATATGVGGQQPAPPSHTNPILFNLKSSSIQASPHQTNSATRFSPHTIKRP